VTTTTATMETAVPPKKKKLPRILAVVAISVGIVYLVDAIVGFGPKTFEAPTVGELFEFKPIFTVGGFDVTFPTIVMFSVTALLILFFVRAFSKPTLVPKGTQNVAEAGVEFIRENIAIATIGPEGASWVPFLTAIFFWVFLNNFMSILPGVQFPVTSRMSYPVTLAITSWVVFNVVGIRKQGFFKYFKNIMLPPGVPPGINVLLAIIELFSTVIVRPITLSVRLFANMVAGHMILGVLFIASSVFIAGNALGHVGFIAPFGLSIALMALELFVIAMQAFIFTILTAVYIGGALHPEH
jgi:F-type H+-transporting ATPase subunit a